MRSSSISRKPKAFGAIVLTVAGLAVTACFFADVFFTDVVDSVTSLASAFGFKLLVPEMRPPSPRPSLVLGLDIFKQLLLRNGDEYSFSDLKVFRRVNNLIGVLNVFDCRTVIASDFTECIT